MKVEHLHKQLGELKARRQKMLERADCAESARHELLPSALSGGTSARQRCDELGQEAARARADAADCDSAISTVEKQVARERVGHAANLKAARLDAIRELSGEARAVGARVDAALAELREAAGALAALALKAVAEGRALGTKNSRLRQEVSAEIANAARRAVAGQHANVMQSIHASFCCLGRAIEQRLAAEAVRNYSPGLPESALSESRAEGDPMPRRVRIRKGFYFDRKPVRVGSVILLPAFNAEGAVQLGAAEYVDPKGSNSPEGPRAA